MVTMPANGLLLPPSFPRVCRNLPNILTHWVCALSIFGWLPSAYVGSPRYLVSLKCCFPACCQGSRAIPALQETHPLSREPQGLLNHTTSSADFFFFCLLRWLTLPKQSPLETMVSPCLSGGDFSGGFGSLGFPGLCGFQMAFQYFPCPSSVSH